MQHEWTEEEVMARVLPRCVEEGDCLIWQGAMQDGTTPAIKLPGETNTLPIRRLLLQARGFDMTGLLADTKCNTPGCVDPNHLTPKTRKQLHLDRLKTNPYHANPVRRAKLSQARAQATGMTPELIEAVRAAEGTQREIAKQFGLCQSSVGAIRRHDTYRVYTNNPWAALANLTRAANDSTTRRHA